MPYILFFGLLQIYFDCLESRMVFSYFWEKLSFYTKLLAYALSCWYNSKKLWLFDQTYWGQSTHLTNWREINLGTKNKGNICHLKSIPISYKIALRTSLSYFMDLGIPTQEQGSTSSTNKPPWQCNPEEYPG